MKFGVSFNKEQALKKEMEKYGVRESDIVEKFIHSRGPGGQNVNKTSTCVYIKHIPTGIEIKCQRERSQSINRFLARRMLVKKIEQMIWGRKSEEEKKIEKLRRQKRKRSRRAREKLLALKHHQSEKKKNRAFKPGTLELVYDE